jgi:MFS family permease
MPTGREETTMTAVADGHLVPDDRLARRNAVVLAVAQMLGGANTVVLFATASIVGNVLAPDKTLATLPASIYVVGLWMGTLPMGWLARHFGRRTAFQFGTACGVLTGLFCCIGILAGSFLLFNIGAFFTGFYAAATQAYRFAAADTASERFRPKAISWVLVGGVGGAILGPQLVIATENMWQPHLFAATYLGQSVIAVIAGGVLMLLNIPRSATGTAGRTGRPLREIARQPRFIVAVACGVASFSVMNIVMTAAPLAMIMCNHTTRDSTLGLQWHVLGMFVPSFFTGSLIARFGVEKVIAAGLLLLLASAAVSIGGITVAHFWVGLILLGVGWNFGFVGATAMVTQCHRPEERTSAQSFNDFLVFGTMVIGSLASGGVLATYGWSMVNQMVFPVIAVALGMLVWLSLTGRRRTA